MNDPTRDVWKDMRRRCLDPRHKEFSRYGGRGITICKRWNSYQNFLNDMGPKPEGMTIERNDNEGSYRPSNCRWASMAEQNRNTRRNHFLELNGLRFCLRDWDIILGFGFGTTRGRLLRGWSTEKALTTPKMRERGW